MAVTKRERKLQDRLNRLAKLAPGRNRIAELDRIGQELRIEADVREEDYAAAPVAPLSAAECRAVGDGLRADALFVARLAWDLEELRGTVRGNPRRTNVELSKYDPANWKGPRP